MYEAIAEILYNDKTKIEEYKNDENNIEKEQSEVNAEGEDDHESNL